LNSGARNVSFAARLHQKKSNMTGLFEAQWRIGIIAFIFCMLFIASQVAQAADPDAAAPDSFEDEVITYDPFERFNRGVHRFNQWFDKWIFEPTAKGYDWVLPDPVQNAVSRAFVNLTGPTVVINDMLQGKWRQAGADSARFVVNSTIGLLGFLDVATRMGLDPHDEDFGQTLGVWGVGEGPYLVLPIIGPRNFRDTAGLGVDILTDVNTWIEDDAWRYGLYTLRLINQRARLLGATDVVTQAAGDDTYIFVRESFRSYRRNLIYDGNPPPPAFLEEDSETPQRPQSP
jgi:phospholipid-binding lipoprotein MlaA